MDRKLQVKALASEPRLEILRLLAAPQKNFGHQRSADPVQVGVCMTLIADALAIAQPTASRHLDILKNAGFIAVDQRQKWSYCKRNEEKLQDYLAWIGEQLALPSKSRRHT